MYQGFQRYRMNFKTLLSIAAVAAVTQVTGCTLIPHTAQLDVPTATATKPSNGTVVKIVSAVDKRQFVYPYTQNDCETPSTDGAEMLNDTVAKNRSFARRGGCHSGEWALHAMVMVPEGQTVAGNVAGAVEAGMKQSGFKFDPADPNAVPVIVSVNKFWVARDLDGMGARYWYTHDLEVKVGEQTYTLANSQNEKIWWEMSASNYVRFANADLQSIANEAAQKIVTPAVVTSSTN